MARDPWNNMNNPSPYNFMREDRKKGLSTHHKIIRVVLVAAWAVIIFMVVFMGFEFSK